MIKKLARKTTLTVVLFLFSLAVNGASLLSNFDSAIDGDYEGTPDAANPFTTGTSPIEIGSISVNWEVLGGTPGINTVGIYEDNAGIPGGVLIGTLFTNPNPTEVGQMRYVGNAVLSANTSYWVVIDINDNSNPSYTFTNTVISDSSTGGATIPDRSAFGSIDTGSWDDDPASLLIELDDLIFANGFE